MFSSTSVQSHYNHVTDAWKEIMGDNFHFGYFEQGSNDMDRAAEKLTEKMIRLSGMTRDSRVLDVGCGIGSPAFYIHTKIGSSVVGISTSKRGVEIAQKLSWEKGYANKVQFHIADGVNNGFPDNSFDVAWVMESSHLMMDKQSLFNECYRVCVSGGTMVLCDIILLNPPPNIAYVKYGRKILRLFKAWGRARLHSLGTYANGLANAGFKDIHLFDISSESAPTIKAWRTQALRLRESLPEKFSRSDLSSFIKGCDSLEYFFSKEIFGYGMIKAVK